MVTKYHFIKLWIQVWNRITLVWRTLWNCIAFNLSAQNQPQSLRILILTQMFSALISDERKSLFFVPLLILRQIAKRTEKKRHFSKQIFFAFLLNSNYLLGFEGIENACNDYCGNWKVSKKNCFMLTARSIIIVCAIVYNPGETEDEWQKTEQVPILLLKGARSFFDAKKVKKKFLLAWTSEIIQFIRYPIQMDRTERSNFFGGKSWLFIVIQLCYNRLWPFTTRKSF